MSAIKETKFNVATSIVFEHQRQALELSKSLQEKSVYPKEVGCDCDCCDIFIKRGLMDKVHEAIRASWK